jgi:hypothetical protein
MPRVTARPACATSSISRCITSVPTPWHRSGASTNSCLRKSAADTRIIMRASADIGRLQTAAEGDAGSPPDLFVEGRLAALIGSAKSAVAPCSAGVSPRVGWHISDGAAQVCRARDSERVVTRRRGRSGTCVRDRGRMRLHMLQLRQTRCRQQVASRARPQQIQINGTSGVPPGWLRYGGHHEQPGIPQRLRSSAPP